MDDNELLNEIRVHRALVLALAEASEASANAYKAFVEKFPAWRGLTLPGQEESEEYWAWRRAQEEETAAGLAIWKNHPRMRKALGFTVPEPELPISIPEEE